MTLLADWLQSLGAATLGALWMPLLAWTAVAFAAVSLLRLWRSAHTLVHYAARTALLLALPLGLFLAAVTDLSILALFPSAAAETSIEPIFILPLMDFNPAAAPAAPAWTLYHLLGLLTMLAGVLAAGRLYYLARHALALTRFRKHLPPHPDASIQQAVDRLSAALGIQRRVRAVVTTQDVVPMTLGWLRPVIVVPETLTGDEEHLHMTLLHELIHIRRQDVLLQGVEYVIGALFLINPAVWLLRRSIGQYREMSCDAEVVTQPRVSSKRYAALLYRFASPPSFRRRLVLSMSASDHELKKRILAMKSHLRPAHQWFSPKFIGFALAALLLTSVTAFVACSDLVGSNTTVDETSQNAASKTDVFTVVEEMPELIGGLKAIQAQLHYPKIASEAGLEGRVIIQFVVDEQGRVVDPKVVKGLGGGLDEEALRVISQARFKPGKQAGKAVPVNMSLPFTFRLGDGLQGKISTFEWNSVEGDLGGLRSKMVALEERLQNNPNPSEKAILKAEMAELVQQAMEFAKGRFEELQEQTIEGQNRPAQTPEGTVEMSLKVAEAEREKAMLVDEMPKLIGGIATLQTDLKYPTIAKRAGIEGRVILEFTVDEQGRVVDPRVLQGIGGGCDEEALRVVQQARFEPARKDGQPVRLKMSLPFTFKLANQESAIGTGNASIDLQDSPPSGKVVVEPPQTLSLGTMQIVGLRRTEIGLQGRVVVAETGEALVGATVLNREKRIGTATDLDGNFILYPDVTVVSVSFTGYESVELHVASRLIDQSDSRHDDAGAGLANNEYDLRSDLVPGSVRVTSNGTTLQEDADYRVDYQAGTVTITNSDYLAAGRDIEIDYEPNARLDSQGQKQMNALEAGENPLYLVDGIPTPGNTRPDPKQLDIASVSVLKGAAAQALYGARAAHGVVEITTVQGRSEH